MRIILMGEQAFAAAVLEKLVEAGEQVVAAYTPPDRRGEPVRQAASKAGIPVFRTSRMRDSQVVIDYVALEADLGVMAFVTDIVPLSIMRSPRFGTIEYHPSLLPKHRGGSAINWAIIQGDTKTGLTIFWPDEGIDTGPILLQKEVSISPEDTAASIYFNKLFPLGVEALAEAVDLVKQGIAPRIPQDESQATHEGLCTEREAIIDWVLPAPKVYNLIRGCNPRPGATAYFRQKPVKIFDSELLPALADSTPGQVVQIDELGFDVAATGGAIRIKRVQYEPTAKITATEFVQLLGLKSGDQFD
ncbi:methionyl-tRNA formyltransferase [Chloroflexota bacterium]